MQAEKLRRAERLYCPRFVANLTVSAEDASTLARIVPGVETRIVANGVDTEFFTPRADPGGKTLLFCGGLDWYPNGEAMAYFFDEIWPKLTAQQPDIRITVVGRKPPEWLTQLGEADARIMLTGFVDDVRPYFKEAVAYICPIRTGGGTRLKILDALAMGMPLIGTTFACSGISVQDEKHVLLADTAPAFAEQIIRALSSVALRERLAAAGRDHICRHFSWSGIGGHLHKAYCDVSEKSSQRTS